MFLTITFSLLTCEYDSSAVDIMPKLKRNILNFGYGVNFKYQGMLSHSFNRFYVIAKYGLPKVSDLKLKMIEFDLNFSHLNNDRKYMTKLKKHCRCRFLNLLILMLKLIFSIAEIIFLMSQAFAHCCELFQD